MHVHKGLRNSNFCPCSDLMAFILYPLVQCELVGFASHIRKLMCQVPEQEQCQAGQASVSIVLQPAMLIDCLQLGNQEDGKTEVRSAKNDRKKAL